MAGKTVLDADDARAVLAAVGGGGTVALREALAHKGTINSNYRVRGGDGRTWFVRVNEGKDDAEVAAEGALLAALVAAGVPTPPMLRAGDGEAFVRRRGLRVSVFPWVDGREAVAIDDAALAGWALARLHTAALGDEVPTPRNRYTLAALAARLPAAQEAAYACDNSVGMEARAALVLIAETLAEAEARDRLALPGGVIHQDLFPDNLLVGADGRVAAIIDFEQATRGPWIYDVAVALLAFAWPSASASAALLAAYEETRALTAGERAALDGELRLAAARFCLTRITDVWMASELDGELRQRKHFREYATRLERLRAARGRPW